jgi:sulfite reductase (NADPH) flavoprotein alpha-component
VNTAPKSESWVPVLPDTAPFTAEQRAYLNGFFAGLFSRARVSPKSEPELVPLTILFASQTGNAENLAKQAAKEASKHGFAATVHDVGQYDFTQLSSERHLLVVASTYGDGEPPDNSKAFWQWFSGEDAPTLPQIRFSVCALGDSNYPKFCAFGKNLDARFVALGAQRASPLVECDVDFDEPFKQWITLALSSLTETKSPASADEKKSYIEFPPEVTSLTGATQPAVVYSRSKPFEAPLMENRVLNGPGSGKETRHLAFSLEGSGLTYEAGDALGVVPTNCPQLVSELLSALKWRGDELVTDGQGQSISLQEALLRHYDITKIGQPLLKSVAEKSGDTMLAKLTVPGVNGELSKFMWGRDVVDLLSEYPQARFEPEEFVKLLKKLQPRLYSIASSPKAAPGQVHLCVAVVRYASRNRPRKGVCSTFLADRVPDGTAVPIFAHTNKQFRLPPDGDIPIIMVGPGTGIAPFKAFLDERRARGDRGRNWLFFGDQHAATDFIYGEHLRKMAADGALTRLDTAFSRDQAEKVYVQHRILEHARELFAWLEEGAYFYVCGDASRMAKDVDAALHKVIETAGRSVEQAADYVGRLRADKRYQRDIY